MTYTYPPKPTNLADLRDLVLTKDPADRGEDAVFDAISEIQYYRRWHPWLSQRAATLDSQNFVKWQEKKKGAPLTAEEAYPYPLPDSSREETLRKLDEKWAAYCAHRGLPADPPPSEPRPLTAENLCRICEGLGSINYECNKHAKACPYCDRLGRIDYGPQPL